MAEAPKLLTTNEPTGYAPYSITALLAVILASLFLAALVILGGAAFVGGQQLVEPLLLVLPAGILVLAFAARRQILNSEGTRAGLNLCTFSWWVAILGGCGYAAYLGGRMIGVQQDTKGAIVAWVALLEKGDPVDTRNLDFHNAFAKTLDTGRQQSVELAPRDGKAPDKKEIEAAQKGFADDTPGAVGLVRFRQIDLVRILYRNRGYQPQAFAFDGIQSWQQDTSGLRSKATGTLTTAEGEFKLNFDMMRQIQDGRPVWRVVVPPQGFIAGARVNRYGQRLVDLEMAGQRMVYEIAIKLAQDVPQFRPLLAQHLRSAGFQDLTFLKPILPRSAAFGGIGGHVPDPPGYETLVKSQLFAPLDRGDPAKDGDARAKFYTAWREGYLSPPGVILKESPDQYPLMTVTDKSLELRVPVEIQQPRMETTGAAARGAVVLVIDDADFMTKLNQLRKDAATEPLVDLVPPRSDATIPWRVRHIESDMKNVSMPKQGPSGPPQPGMAPQGMPPPQ